MRGRAQPGLLHRELIFKMKMIMMNNLVSDIRWLVLTHLSQHTCRPQAQTRSLGEVGDLLLSLAYEDMTQSSLKDENHYCFSWK